MIEPVGTDLFRVHFLKAPRPRTTLWGWFTAPRAVVDGWAVGQAVSAALPLCEARSVSGAVQIWNEYRLFMAAQDLERLRPMEGILQRDLMELLRRQITHLGAETIGDVEVHLVADEGGETTPGTGLLRVAFRPPDARRAAPVDGQLTVRFSVKRPSAAPSASTQRVGAARVVGPGGAVPLQEQTPIVLGRADEDAASDHVALPGASKKVSRRHVAIRVEGNEVELRREPNSNPVRVNGRSLAPNEAVRVPMPTQLVLADDTHLTVEKC